MKILLATLALAACFCGTAMAGEPAAVAPTPVQSYAAPAPLQAPGYVLQRVAKIVMQKQQRTRQVPYTVTEKRTIQEPVTVMQERIIDVPVTKFKTETYEVDVPVTVFENVHVPCPQPAPRVLTETVCATEVFTDEHHHPNRRHRRAERRFEREEIRAVERASRPIGKSAAKRVVKSHVHGQYAP